MYHGFSSSNGHYIIRRERTKTQISNTNTRIQLTLILKNSFTAIAIHTKQAQDNTDTHIVITVMDLTQQNSFEVIMREDVDLLVIMIGRCRCVH